MLTLGAGVGSGIVIDGELFEGGGIGGSELGHMVIEKEGRLCTCGRNGCLEAYASLTALRQEVKEADGRELSPEQIFQMAAAGDRKLEHVVLPYIQRLGTGVVNSVNIFRPQMILFGGVELPEPYLEVIRSMVRNECFGGEQGELPAVENAQLGCEAGMIGAASL